MNTATISTKYQVVIPKSIRNTLKIFPGQKVTFICYDNHLEMIPLADLKELVGICDGMDTTIEREEADRI
jgi:AbrB family looped-hinge helix DNA binding protein